MAPSPEFKRVMSLMAALALFTTFTIPLPAQASPNEAQALLKWKSNLGNHSNSSLSSWTPSPCNATSSNSTVSPCAWYGISCNQAGSVIGIISLTPMSKLPRSKIALLFLFLCLHIASASLSEEIQSPFPGHDGKQGLHYSIVGTRVPEWAIIPLVLIIVVAILVIVYFYCRNPIPVRCRWGCLEMEIEGNPPAARQTSG